MENQFIDQLAAVTTKSYAVMKDLGDINFNALRKVTDLQFEFIGMNMGAVFDQAELLKNKTEIKDIFASDAEFVGNYNEKVVNFTGKMVEIFTETRDETRSLFEMAMASETAPVKHPAKASKAKPAKKAA